jgi:histidine triad (HIT) family protein
MTPFMRLYALQQSYFQPVSRSVVTGSSMAVAEHIPPSQLSATPAAPEQAAPEQTTSEKSKQTTACIFCAIHAGTIPSTIIAQNSTAFVIKDISPQAPVHYLIIPKKHTTDIQSLTATDLGVMADIADLAQQLSRIDAKHAEFKLVSNNGKNAGQHVMHLHIHFLAGF